MLDFKSLATVGSDFVIYTTDTQFIYLPMLTSVGGKFQVSRADDA